MQCNLKTIKLKTTNLNPGRFERLTYFFEYVLTEDGAGQLNFFIKQTKLMKHCEPMLQLTLSNNMTSLLFICY